MVRYNSIFLMKLFFPKSYIDHTYTHYELVYEKTYHIIEQFEIKILYDSQNNIYRITFNYGCDTNKEIGYLYDKMKEYYIDEIFTNLDDVQLCLNKIYNHFHNKEIIDAYAYDWISYTPWEEIINTDNFCSKERAVNDCLNLKEIRKIIKL